MTSSNVFPMPAVNLPSAAILDLLEADIANDALTVDDAATFPYRSVTRLSEAGLLTWYWHSVQGRRHGTDFKALCHLLVRIGRASLTVGRLFEGHVNAAALLDAYGSEAVRKHFYQNALNGQISGVWNAENGTGLVATPINGGWLLTGEKIFCSGAGSIKRPIVTARTSDDQNVLMMMPNMDDEQISVDLTKWRPTGMRGTATGTVSFDDAYVPDHSVIGGPGDYYRSPLFSGGAWRVLAVQLGGLQHILALHAQRLVDWDRSKNQSSRTRFATAAQQLEIARLIVKEASTRAHDILPEPGAVDAYVDASRCAFEMVAVSIIETTRRNIGLSTYITPDPLDLVLRDLETYLRQPMLDASQENAAQWLLHRQGRFTT